VAALPAATLTAAPPAAAPDHETSSCGQAGDVPNVIVSTHEGRKALFYTDMLRGRTAMINFMSIAGEAADPVTASLAQIYRRLGERAGREAFLYSITIDPERDTPRALRDFAARYRAGPGWLFLTGEPAAIRALHEHFFEGTHQAHAHGGAGPIEDGSRGLVRYGNEAAGLWGLAPVRSDPAWLAARLEWACSRSRLTAAGPPRRRGPARLALGLVLLLAAGLLAATPSGAGDGSFLHGPYLHPPSAAAAYGLGDHDQRRHHYRRLRHEHLPAQRAVPRSAGNQLLAERLQQPLRQHRQRGPEHAAVDAQRPLQPARRPPRGEGDRPGLSARRPIAYLRHDQQLCDLA
jgi:protein SCO1/2